MNFLQALENSPGEHNSCDLNCHQQQLCVNNDELSSDYDESLFEDFSDSDSWSDDDDDITVSICTNTLLFFFLVAIRFHYLFKLTSFVYEVRSSFTDIFDNR